MSPNNFFKSEKHGFTMVELLIVMTIIGMLVTMGTFSYQGVMQKARNQQRKSDLTKIKKALIEYYADNGEYPRTLVGGVAIPGCIALGWCGMCSDYSEPDGALTTTGPSGYIPNLAPQYIDVLPRDPREGKSNKCGASGNCYIYRSDGYDFKVIAYCTPEGKLSKDDSFYDPYIWEAVAGDYTNRWEYAWQVSSGDTPARTW